MIGSIRTRPKNDPGLRISARASAAPPDECPMPTIGSAVCSRSSTMSMATECQSYGPGCGAFCPCPLLVHQHGVGWTTDFFDRRDHRQPYFLAEASGVHKHHVSFGKGDPRKPSRLAFVSCFCHREPSGRCHQFARSRCSPHQRRRRAFSQVLLQGEPRCACQSTRPVSRRRSKLRCRLFRGRRKGPFEGGPP